jgi:hypothetical protein
LKTQNGRSIRTPSGLRTLPSNSSDKASPVQPVDFGAPARSLRSCTAAARPARPAVCAAMEAPRNQIGCCLFRLSSGPSNFFCRTPSWWRRARISSGSEARVRTLDRSATSSDLRTTHIDQEGSSAGPQPQPFQ